MGEEKKVTRRDYLKYTGAAIGGLVVGGALGYLAKPAEVIKKTVTAPGAATTVTKTVEKIVTAPASFWAKAAEPYRGTTIHVITESTPPSLVLGKYISEFEKETGIKVEYETTYYDDVYAKSMADFSAHTGIYDVIYVEIEWLGAYAGAGYIYPIEDMMREHQELTDPNLDLEDFITLKQCSYKGKVYTLPYEFFGYVYYYRKDLFEKYAKEFEKEYGRPLEVPKTMEEYEDIAKFFTGKEPELYGHLAQAKTHNALVCDWENFHCMFGPPEYEKCFIDWDRMRADGVVNSSWAVEALEYYIRLLKYAPPGALTYTWDEAAAAMQMGMIAQGPLWGDWVMSMYDPTVSKVVGKLGFAPMPGLSKNPNAKRMNACASGWGINADSKKKEAAWLFIQWAKRKEFEPLWVIQAGVICRKSSLEHPAVKIADKYYGNYFTAQMEAAKFSYFPLIIPEYAEMKTAAEEPLGLAVTGKISAKEALDMLAERWNEILKRSYP